MYRSARIEEGDEDPRDVEPEGFSRLLGEARAHETHLYFPAPPLGVDPVDLYAGVFGLFEDLPLE